MKKIEAIIRSSKFEDVKEGLEEIGLKFFSFLEIKGHGREKEDDFTYRGVPYDSGFIPRQKLEIILRDEDVEKVVDVICENAKTGNIGDGKVIVTNVESFVRIRSGETSELAL